jgi:hypothetical protein
VLRGDVELKLAVPRVVALKPRVMQKSYGGNLRSQAVRQTAQAA